MNSHTELRARLERDAHGFASHPLFAALESGRGAQDDYDGFLRRVAVTHLKAPQALAFLWAVSPPSIALGIRTRMLEESGIEPDGLDSPAQLERLLRAVGLSREVRALHAQAQNELQQSVIRPLRFRSLRDLGLAVLVEVAAFDYLLDLMASRIATMLNQYRGVPQEALGWFARHTELGRARADESIDQITTFVAHYAIPDAEVQPVIDAVLQGNLFLQRYFGPVVVPAAAALGTACLRS